VFNLTNRERCGECSQNKGTDMAICLLCGLMVCAGAGSPCHLQHTKGRCDGRTGMFLSVKRCDVILVHDSAWCFWGSLYLDDHGEEDLHLRRGRPLSLSQDRCEQLVALYLSVGLDNFIAVHHPTTSPPYPASLHASFVAHIFFCSFVPQHKNQGGMHHVLAPLFG
jgi:hypothetical protein